MSERLDLIILTFKRVSLNVIRLFQLFRSLYVSLFLFFFVSLFQFLLYIFMRFSIPATFCASVFLYFPVAEDFINVIFFSSQISCIYSFLNLYLLPFTVFCVLFLSLRGQFGSLLRSTLFCISACQNSIWLL